MTRNVTLSESAFVSMVTASAELYKKESYGNLLGAEHKKHYMVYDTINFQSAKRSSVQVTISKKKLNDINYALKHLTDLKAIGEYHSHPDANEKMSAWDKKEFLKGAVCLAIIVSINHTHRHRKWEFNSDLTLSGSIGRKFFLKIAAYECSHNRKKIYPIKIVCPYIRRLNKEGQFHKIA